jgi:hypothetical protein
MGVADPALYPMQQAVVAPPLNAGGTAAPLGTEPLYWHVVHEPVDQHGGAPHPPHIIALIGLLKTAVEVLDGGATQLYPDLPGCILLSSCSPIIP